MKEKEDRIAFNRGPIISPTRKGEPKKQSPRVLQFLIRVTKILMCKTSMCAFVLPFWIPYQRKGGPNCSEQEPYNFSHKKMRAEEAKGPAVSYQTNHYITELLIWMSFIVVFVTSIYTLFLNGTLKFSYWIFVLAIVLLGGYHKSEEYTG